MLEQLFADQSAEQVKFKAIVIFGQSIRVKAIFTNGRWQTFTSREDLIEITQTQIDALCRIYGWQQGQPSRVSTMDFLYTFERPAGQVAFGLRSKAVEQNHSRHLRNLAEQHYGPAVITQPSTDWKSAKEAIAYGVRVGAFMDDDEARKAYFSMRDRIQPTEPAQIFRPWLELCRDLVAEWEYDEARERDTKGIMF